MKSSVSITIGAPVEKVWSVMTNIENATETISAINSIEVLEKPESGVVGLKWKETRTMFGKEASEIMWITEAEENHYYKTRAESHGSIYETDMRVVEQDGKSLLSMEFSGEPQTLMAKVMGFLMMPLMKSSMEQALKKDLEDMKAAAEAL